MFVIARQLEADAERGLLVTNNHWPEACFFTNLCGGSSGLGSPLVYLGLHFLLELDRSAQWP